MNKIKLSTTNQVQEALETILQEIYFVNPEIIKDESKLYSEVYRKATDYYVEVPCESKTYLDKNTNQLVTINTKEDGLIHYIQRDGSWKAVIRLLDFSKLPKKPINHKPDNNKFVEAVYHIYWNTNAYQFGSTLTSVRKFCENIHYNIGTEGARKQDICLYQFSSRGGSGKSFIASSWSETLKTLGYDAGPVKVNERWVGSEFSRHLVSYQDEFFPPRGLSRDSIISKLNPIICNDFYEVEYKGQDAYFLKSQTSLVLNSNYLPFDTNDRRYSVISFNNIDFSKEQNQTRIVTQKDDYAKWMLQALESCPFGKVWENPIKCTKSSTNELIYMVRNTLETEVNFSIQSGTIRSFAEAYLKASGLTTRKPLEVSREILNLILEADIQPVKRINGRIEYSKFDWDAIANMETSETEHTHDILDNIKDELKATEVAAKLYMENKGPDGGKDDESDKEFEVVETEQSVETIKERKPVEVASNENQLVENTPAEPDCKKAVESWWANMFGDIKPEDICLKSCPLAGDCTEEGRKVVAETFTEGLVFTPEDAKQFGTPICENKMSKPQFETTGEFLVTAEYTEEAKKEIMAGKDIDRKGENMRPVFFVYESDDLPKEVQLKMAMEVKEKFPEAVFSITDSGSKSVHTLVYIKPEFRDLVKKDFKYAWKLVGEKLFGSTEHLDKQCASVARLSRLPGGIRENGSKQNCYYINRKVAGMDLEGVCYSIAQHLNRKEQSLRQYLEVKKQLEDKGINLDTVEHLKGAVAKSNNPAGQLAVDLVEGRQTPSGSNLIGAIGYAQRLCGPYVASLVREEAHRQHPSNIR